MGSGWPEATLYLRVALIAVCVGYIFFLIGFSTDHWQIKEHHGARKIFGLWILWVYEHPKEFTGIVDAMENPLRLRSEGWYRATQVLECFGFISFTIGTLVYLLYFFVPFFKQRVVLLAIIWLTVAAVVFIIIGTAIFGAEMSVLGYTTGWSMALAIVGAILACLSGVMELMEYLR